MGAKCAYPDRPVVCFAGDGGVWYHLQELDTARKYGINTITVLNNNHSFNQEKRNVELTYGGQSAKSDELWLLRGFGLRSGCRVPMGCVGLTVNTPAEFAPAFHQALTADKPVLIDVKSHIEGVAPRAWMPK